MSRHRADDDVTHPILEGGACVVLFCSVVVVVVVCLCFVFVFFCLTSQHSLKLVARLKWSACAESACAESACVRACVRVCIHVVCIEFFNSMYLPRTCKRLGPVRVRRSKYSLLLLLFLFFFYNH